MLYLNVVDTHKEIFHGQIRKVTAPGVMGGLTIYPGHSQLITLLKLGELHYTTPDEKDQMMFVSGGILEVQPTMVTILADTILRSDEEDAEEAKKSIERAKTEIKKVKMGTAEFADLQREIEIISALLEVYKLTGKLRLKRY